MIEKILSRSGLKYNYNGSNVWMPFANADGYREAAKAYIEIGMPETAKNFARSSIEEQSNSNVMLEQAREFGSKAEDYVGRVGRSCGWIVFLLSYGANKADEVRDGVKNGLTSAYLRSLQTEFVSHLGRMEV